ncbi:Efflux pump membrane transporter BepG [compost metagenome]
MVQNRVAQALPRLPEDVQRLGVTTIKSTPTLTMDVNLVSESGRYDKDYLRNYAVINIKDQLARIQGMGQVLIWGAGDYSRRRAKIGDRFALPGHLLDPFWDKTKSLRPFVAEATIIPLILNSMAETLPRNGWDEVRKWMNMVRRSSERMYPLAVSI